MDNRLYDLVGQLEDLVDRGGKVPLTNKIMVDEDNILNLLDHIKRAMPEEIKQANAVLADRERMMEEARNEAKRIVDRAQKQAEHLISEDEVAKRGRAQAEDMVAQAQQYYREMKRGALMYSNDLFQELEDRVEGFLRMVQSNRQELMTMAKDDGEGR